MVRDSDESIGRWTIQWCRFGNELFGPTFLSSFSSVNLAVVSRTLAKDSEAVHWQCCETVVSSRGLTLPVMSLVILEEGSV